jgi:hypothetical protein
MSEKSHVGMDLMYAQLQRRAQRVCSHWQEMKESLDLKTDTLIVWSCLKLLKVIYLYWS